MAERSILIVDPDSLTRGLLEARFDSLGWRTLTAESSDEALALAKENKPDVITTEASLLGSSGQELTRAVRSDPDPVVANVPVLVVSFLDRTSDVVEGLCSGADCYITKPFDMAELEARVEAVVRRAEMSR